MSAIDQPTIEQAGTFTLGGRAVKRLGYGAMQLAGPGMFGPPKDRGAALAVLLQTQMRDARSVGGRGFRRRS